MKSKEIGRVLGSGRRKRGSSVDLFVAPSTAAHARFGLIVPKYDRNSVQRNLVKRRLREIARKHVLPKCDEMGERMDVLARARRRAYAASFDALKKEMLDNLEGEWRHVS